VGSRFAPPVCLAPRETTEAPVVSIRYPCGVPGGESARVLFVVRGPWYLSSVLVVTPKPRLVKLVISPHGDDPFSVAGASNRGAHFEIKIDFGGVASVVAPMVRKQPLGIQLWIIGGDAPTFIREQGQSTRRVQS
jgi:hypothetical protein